MPLPDKEAKALADSVLKLVTEGMVPLKAHSNTPVTLDDRGCFCVHFDLPSWAIDAGANSTATKTAMISKVNKVISGSNAWQQGPYNSLKFKSTQAFPELKGNPKPSKEFLEFMEITEMPSDPIVCALLALQEKKGV